MENNITLQVGVKVLLKNKEGKYLLLRRSLEKYPEVEARWDIVGGRIDPGKTLRENLEREVQEETGLKIVGDPKLIVAQDILQNAGRHIVRLTYLGEATGEVVLDTTENDVYRWYTWDELVQAEDVNRYFKASLNDSSLWLCR